MLSNILNQYKIILGSKSPRRQQFLKELNIPFEIREIDCEEIYPHHLEGAAITEFLAEYKSNAYTLKENELLITADTIVWCDESALEKPKNKEQAIKMLQLISNHQHEVITSVCIATLEKTVVFTEKTTVFFDKLTNNEIDYYIETFKPYDKAGSYGIQEWIGHIGVKKIEGSYANVVGLPVQKLYQTLKNF